MNEIKLIPCYNCGQKMRICFTGRKWMITCDNDDCPTRNVYGKTAEEVSNKWNGNLIK